MQQEKHTKEYVFDFRVQADDALQILERPEQVGEVIGLRRYVLDPLASRAIITPIQHCPLPRNILVSIPQELQKQNVPSDEPRYHEHPKCNVASHFVAQISKKFGELES